MSPRATVVIPTHNHGPTLLYSGRSALNQTVEDLELFIVGDGVTGETRAAAQELAAEDERVRFFDNPKGLRLGETHRHAALQEARGEVVCYLSDDDLWLPEHVETMLRFLQEADFAGAMQVVITPEGRLKPTSGDLSLSHYRELLLSRPRGVNRVPLSSGAHTMEMYRRLPHGWRTSPPEAATDLYMWQQFLSIPDCRAVSTARPTVLQFPSPQRKDWTEEERIAELETWSRKAADPAWRQGFVYEVLDRSVRGRAAHVARLERRARDYEEQLRDHAAELGDLKEKHLRLRTHHQRYKQQIEGSRSWKLAQAISRLSNLARKTLRRGS